MPRDGAGNYGLPSGNPVVTNTIISSGGWANPTLSDIATALTQSLSRDGQTTPTADLTMGNFKLRNLANALARTDAVNAGQIQDGGLVTLSSVSGTDTITASTAPAITAYTAGQAFDLPVAGANTTNNVTININALGAKNVTKFGGVGLVPGDLQGTVRIRYDGTQFQLISAPAVAMAPVGASRNVLMSIAAAGTSATWTADEFEVKSALGGTGQLLTNLSLTFNGLTTGAGGMDTGSIPTSGFLGVYVIWGIGKTTALYGANASAASKLSDVYAGGTGLPSGYTHSALISIVPTNGSAQILPCYQNDPSGRAVGFPAVTAASGTTTGISSTISLSAIVPFNAKKISGALSATISNASNIQLNIFSRPTQSGGAILSVSSSSGGIGGTTSFSGLSIVTPQSAFASTAGSGTLSSWNIGINEYFF